VHMPIFGSDEVTDVTGAGDTVIATFSLALAAGIVRQARRFVERGAGAVTSDHDTTTENWSQEGPAQGRRG
jgi:D-glycero-beta-D-manno-heptose-7-phosphate kinase